MQNARQVALGIVTAVISLALTIGALALSMAEGSLYAPSSTITATSSQMPTSSLTPTLQTATPLVITPTETPTLSPTPTKCPPPLGWKPYTVQNGDTLGGLAQQYKRTSTEISQANCLGADVLQPGMIIYLPPLPTRTPVPCGRPSGWVIYIVQPGDTLYRLSQAYGITVLELQRANCLTGTLLHVGQSLYVPPWEPVFPTVIYEQTLETPTELPPLDTPSETPTQ
jgi:LysM repeat protein